MHLSAKFKVLGESYFPLVKGSLIDYYNDAPTSRLIPDEKSFFARYQLTTLEKYLNPIIIDIKEKLEKEFEMNIYKIVVDAFRNGEDFLSENKINNLRGGEDGAFLLLLGSDRLINAEFTGYASATSGSMFRLKDGDVLYVLKNQKYNIPRVSKKITESEHLGESIIIHYFANSKYLIN
jgi:hypothetical protein